MAEVIQAHDVLLEKINNLHTKIDEGFKGVHFRQDTQNGRIGYVEKDIVDLKIEDAKICQKLKNERIIWSLVVALVGIISGLVGKLF